MLEVELACVAFMLLVIAWQVAGLHETLFRGQLDLLRTLLEDRQDRVAKRDAEWMVRFAKESIVALDSIPRWRRRLLMLAGR
jgi:hypothetical protein